MGSFILTLLNQKEEKKMKKTKKVLLCAAVAASACMMFTGCVKKQDPVVHIGVDGETVENAEVPVTPMDETQPDATTVMQTVATYQYSEPLEDENGTQNKLIFIDEKGNEFQALVSDFTIVPESMEAGTKYMVHHSAITTRSLPPIYSRVYEIEPVDHVESLAIGDDSEKETKEDTAKSVETDETEVETEAVNETAAEGETETAAEAENESAAE